jgi:hypothetical protein
LNTLTSKITVVNERSDQQNKEVQGSDEETINPNLLFSRDSKEKESFLRISPTAKKRSSTLKKEFS